MPEKRYYLTTRDLLMIAALAALGGVVSTYVNAVGDFFQSLLGFAGTTQWAAGLHVLWLVLAVGLTGKQGAGTVAGLLKGGVELLSGNTHGVLVLLVDVVAGLLVDLGFLPFRNKDTLPAYCLAGGVASASNVLVFQAFASLPSDLLAYGAILLVAAVAAASGVLFAGILGQVLVSALRRAGVVKDRAPLPVSQRVYVAFLGMAVLITVGLGLYLRQALRGPAAVHIGGAVAAPYDYPTQHGDIALVDAEGTLREVTARYHGAPVRELVARAQPQAGAALLVVRGSDGYAFFISMAELHENPGILLVAEGRGDKASYNLVGAKNAKAWVRGVAELTAIGAAPLEIGGAVKRPAPYDPDRWQFEMDSTRLDVGHGPAKYQGAPLGAVLQALGLEPGSTSVALQTGGVQPVLLSLDRVLADGDIRLFTIIADGNISYAVARMDGTVIAAPVTGIEVR
ncbi:MAG TPA: ECF transporter S component [Anaerolineae bacterium]|nr:ECF transporter S component [Anaerolineae bacterium]HOQ97766.1 ECF transporter S component [Anaerolineae bacterium]HPL28291.1 ECF transporter S component [Anaerolineae bacterium]